jgi:hypothetical protein
MSKINSTNQIGEDDAKNFGSVLSNLKHLTNLTLKL